MLRIRLKHMLLAMAFHRRFSCRSEVPEGLSRLVQTEDHARLRCTPQHLSRRDNPTG